MATDARAPRRVLAAVARGALGDRYQPEVAERMARVIEGLWSQSERDSFIRILKLLDTKPGALVLTGRAVPVSWLSASEAEALLQRWKGSRIEATRDLVATLITFSMTQSYGYRSPMWDRIGYPGPPAVDTAKPAKIRPLRIEADEEMTCDVVIVGSGAGGGCVAGELAQRGLDVIVVEKGDYRTEDSFHQESAQSFHDMYLYRGQFATADHGIRLLAGSTLGGGTVVNWSTSWKTPRPVLEEWRRVSGIDAFTSGEIEESLDAVAARLNVSTDASAAGKRDELLEEGLKRLGWHVDAMPRAVRGCAQDERCGFCPYGCRIGAKQSTTRTYLEDAAARGARMIVGADVRRVTIEDGRAKGIEAVCGGHRLTIRARAVVIACGSVETPALLLRSKLKGRVGHNLSLHPGNAIGAVFDDDVRMWEGTMQARYTNELGAAWSGGYGATLETGPLHPYEWSAATPWTSAADHARRMDDYVKTSLVAVLSRDTARGRVKIDKHGVPIVEYKVSREDEERIADGVIAAGAAMEAAGAREIYTTHRSGAIAYRPNGPGAHEVWADEVRKAGFVNGKVIFASMHQMGSCAMGQDPATSVVGAENESHEVRGLFVADASTFPTPSGVNPMLSVYGIAHRAAQKIATRLS
ncbi:MAG: FAD-dependent oxidoreductase [Actinomycetota bacterium]